MTIQAARRILTADIYLMTLEKLQAHCVKLLDAARESEAEYGFEVAVRDGFYKAFMQPGYAPGFVPADLWLSHNLWERLKEAQELEAVLFRQADTQ